MQKLFLLMLFVVLFAEAKYMDNKSCAECHEKIYDEFQSSMHSKGYFNDELHRKVADVVSMKTYDCAVCHMPMANNLADIVSGKARPNKNNKTHTDAISCYFCHTIAYVKKAHRFNVNIKAKQAKNYKPTLYGRLQKPDDSDKHSSVSNPVYGKKVCMGCHSHKLNENNVTIFRAMEDKQDSLDCIRCHMPEVSGGAEKMDKRARGHHASHKFLGIHDVEFRKKGIDINASIASSKLNITLYNKMSHPLVIQSARAKYIKIIISRNQKTIWQNYDKDPSHDKQGYFAYNFERDGTKISIPATATSGHVNNLGGKEHRTLTYNIPQLISGDKVTVGLYLELAKRGCAEAVSLDNDSLMKPQLIKEISVIKE